MSTQQLTAMDNPTGYVNHRLLSASTYVRPRTRHPLRTPSQTFEHFTANCGRTMTRGTDDHHFDNPRVFGNIHISLLYHVEQQNKTLTKLT